MKPDDIPQWAWDEAGRVFCELLSVPSEVYQEESWSLDREHIARALLEAERRGKQAGIAEGMERAAEIAETFRDDNPKPTVYAAIASDIRARAEEMKP